MGKYQRKTTLGKILFDTLYGKLKYNDGSKFLGAGDADGFGLNWGCKSFTNQLVKNFVCFCAKGSTLSHVTWLSIDGALIQERIFFRRKLEESGAVTLEACGNTTCFGLIRKAAAGGFIVLQPMTPVRVERFASAQRRQARTDSGM